LGIVLFDFRYFLQLVSLCIAQDSVDNVRGGPGCDERGVLVLALGVAGTLPALLDFLDETQVVGGGDVVVFVGLDALDCVLKIEPEFLQ